MFDGVTQQHHHRGYDGDMLHGAELLVEFVNTYDLETDDDQMATNDRYLRWLTAQSIDPPSRRRLDHDRNQAIEIREHLRRCLLAHHDGGEDATALADLSRAFEAMPLRLRLDVGSIGVSSLEAPSGQLGERIAGALLDVHASGAWKRLRVCPADDCLEAFYDSSRGGTRRWCSMGDCGNRSKVATYRHRQAADD